MGAGMYPSSGMIHHLRQALGRARERYPRGSQPKSCWTMFSGEHGKAWRTAQARQTCRSRVEWTRRVQ